MAPPAPPGSASARTVSSQLLSFCFGFFVIVSFLFRILPSCGLCVPSEYVILLVSVLLEELQHIVTAVTSSGPVSEVRGHVRSVEGQRVDVSCSFHMLFARHVTRVDKLRWTLNGLTLSPSHRIHISRPQQADREGFWNSTLTFDPVIRLFSGPSRVCFFLYKW